LLASKKKKQKRISFLIGTSVAVTGTKKKKNRKIKSSFKFPVKVGVEESIVNAPLVSLDTKNTNNEKSEVRFKHMIRDL
jgi:hypothetical protein